jgi:hypothetical protein
MHEPQVAKPKPLVQSRARPVARPAALASPYPHWTELQRSVGNQTLSRLMQRRADTGASTQAGAAALYGWISEPEHAAGPLADRIASASPELEPSGETGESRLQDTTQQHEQGVPSTAGSAEETSLSGKYSAHEGDDLRNNLSDLASRGVTDYVVYRDMIARAPAIEKRVALNTVLLARLRDTLDPLSFARCVEALGRKPPTFDELRRNSVVADAIKKAWAESDVGMRDLVSQPHEEGGWIFLNLIDGTLHIERAVPKGANFITLNPPPDVANSVVVAVFHTHPFLGGPRAKPSARDKSLDTRDGVPDLVAANTGADPKVFQIYLSGPHARRHLASDKKLPGPSGGIAP